MPPEAVFELNSYEGYIEKIRSMDHGNTWGTLRPSFHQNPGSAHIFKAEINPATARQSGASTRGVCTTITTDTCFGRGGCKCSLMGSLNYFALIKVDMRRTNCRMPSGCVFISWLGPFQGLHPQEPKDHTRNKRGIYVLLSRPPSTPCSVQETERATFSPTLSHARRMALCHILWTQCQIQEQSVLSIAYTRWKYPRTCFI